MDYLEALLDEVDDVMAPMKIEVIHRDMSVSTSRTSRR
jgi:hypothetical protein